MQNPAHKGFIGSSSEQMDVARAVQVALKPGGYHARLWPNVFPLSKGTLDSLLTQLDEAQFGIFILAADDVALIRGKSERVTRDNVIFELGMFMGRRGPERTFFLIPDNVEIHLPSDLAGLKAAVYDGALAATNPTEAVEIACSEIILNLKRIVTESNDAPLLSDLLIDKKFPLISDISVSAYTGSSTIKTIKKYIEANARTRKKKDRLNLRVLLHAPQLSDKRRAVATKTSIQDLKDLATKYPWVHYDIRFYGSPPILRSVVLRSGSERSAYLSYYDWQRPDETSRRPTGNEKAAFLAGETIVKGQPSPRDTLLSVYDSWFSHYWGGNSTHTIVFDFDDTLFFTFEQRAEAWTEAIRQFLKDEHITPSDLKGELGLIWKTDEFVRQVREILIREQEEGLVAKAIFVDPGKKAVISLLSRRRTIRLERTLNEATPIDQVRSQLPKLRKTHLLAIVTSTGEDLVEKVLDKHGMGDLFSFVFGRDASLNDREDIPAKSQNLIRVASLCGIPLDRMVYVGDSKGDLVAANRLEINFIENAIVAQNQLGRDSLITGAGEEHTHPRIVGHGVDELSRVLASMKK